MDSVAFVHRLASRKRKKNEDEKALLHVQRKTNESSEVQNVVVFYLTFACGCGCLHACIDCICRLSECLCLFLLAALQAAWASEFQLQFQLYIFGQCVVCNDIHTYVHTMYCIHIIMYYYY